MRKHYVVSMEGGEKLMQMGYNEMSAKEQEAAEKEIWEQEQSLNLAPETKREIVKNDWMKRLFAESMRAYINAPDAYLPEELEEEIEGYIRNKDWERACSTIRFNHEWQEIMFCRYFQDIPDEYRRKFLIDLYTDSEGTFPALIYELAGLKSYGSCDFPSELEDKITVYRGGNEDIGEAPMHLSWTLDKKKAIWFMIRPGSIGEKVHLYQGTIDKKDVLAFADDRGEKEIIQFGSVHDVRELTSLTREQAWEVNNADHSDPDGRFEYMEEHGMI